MKKSKRNPNPKFRMMTLGNGNIVFAREKDYNNLFNAIKSHNPKRMVKATMGVLLGSPQMMGDLADATFLYSKIMETESKGLLESLRDIIDYKLNIIEKNKKEKGKNESNNKNKIH
jgi:hypothetical protein